MKFTLEQRIIRLTEWFNRKNDRPIFGFFLDSMYPLHRYRGSRKHLKEGSVNPQDIVVNDYLDDFERLYKIYEQTGGDLIWSASPFFGMPWIEASLGCGVIADFQTGSTRSVPPSMFCEKPYIYEFSEENPWVAKMLEFIPVIEERSRGRYPVGVTLMRGISDLLSALYGGENFIFRMMENPEEIKKVVEELTDYWIAFGKCLLSHLRLFHGGTGAFFYSVWCPGQTIWMQEDAAALLSPAMYEEFICPANVRIIKAFPYTVIHLHPSRFIPVDYLLKTEIDVIELHIDKGGPTAEDLHETHKKILDKKPLLIYGDLSIADLDFILENLQYSGLAINMVVSSPEEAEDVWKRYKERLASRIKQ